MLFFVAVGTLIDPGRLPGGLPWVALMLALVLGGKTLVVYVLARLARLPARPAQLAIGLSQVGEFGYVLATLSLTAGVISRDVFAGVLGTIVVSIAVSTILVRFAGGQRSTPATA